MGYRKNLKDKTLGFFCGQNDKRGGLLQRGITYSDLCTPTSPYCLAGSALPSDFGGS